ncbi:CHAP domain-containing protein [Patescibacteria group bacterium]
MSSKKFYVAEDGLRFRSDPETKNLDNVICELKKGDELLKIDGPWYKVKFKEKEGWVHGDYLMNDLPKQKINLVIGVPNPADSPITKAIRKFINYEFGLDFKKDQLQCTEYVYYRVKDKLGMDVKWPPQRPPRHGKNWPEILKDIYKVCESPGINCAISFRAGLRNSEGHIAFVEKILPNEEIEISDVNFDCKGSFDIRRLKKEEWKDKYNCLFVDFT